MNIWVRCGDADGYNELDSLQEVADYLAGMGATGRLNYYTQYGYWTPEFQGDNYISIFWGPEAGSPTRSLTPDEQSEISRLMEG